jgi:ankyrin repeat protein
VASGVEVNATGEYGWTALHVASYQGLDEVIKFLASKGAKLDAMDGFGQTALSIASEIVTKDIGDAYFQTPRTVHKDTIALLLSLGATPLEKSGVKVLFQRSRVE